MRQLPQVKITTKNGHTYTFIDNYQAHHVTGISAKWDNTGRFAEVTIHMFADIEVDAESELKIKCNESEN